MESQQLATAHADPHPQTARAFLVLPIGRASSDSLHREACAIYARETPLAGSIESQIELCLQAAFRNGWEPNEALTEVDIGAFEDQVDKRPGLSTLMAALDTDSQGYSYLFIGHLAALSEEAHLSHALINLFKSKGVAICCVTHPFAESWEMSHPPFTMFI